MLLESACVRKTGTHYALTLRAVKFQSSLYRQLPCYGNLELPLKIKQESSGSYPAIERVKSEDGKRSDNKERSERDRERDRDRDKDRER